MTDPPASTIISQSQAKELKSNSVKVFEKVLENGKYKNVWNGLYQSKERMKIIQITGLNDQDPDVKIINRYVRFKLDENAMLTA